MERAQSSEKSAMARFKKLPMTAALLCLIVPPAVCWALLMILDVSQRGAIATLGIVVGLTAVYLVLTEFASRR